MRLSIAVLLPLLAGLVPAWDLPPLPAWFDDSKLPALKGDMPDAPEYMVDNTRNSFGVAPDRGSLLKPVTHEDDDTIEHRNNKTRSRVSSIQATGYWAGDIAHGIMPHAPSGYQMFRNVRDFGAVGDGATDDTAAINRAASWMSASNSQERCGVECGQTTRLGAVVYFPPGEYLISSPIIQYYFTSFVGDANNRPTIIGSEDFKGIALIDCDPYIPEGNGANWYINQNQFFRQIKHIKFNLEKMALHNYEHDQEYAPTGIHWQVSQAASLQNLDFRMPLPGATGAITAVGIFMENGSGGFLSDITFFGGMIGFRAGSQQYTARNLHFQLTNTAISMIWDWGFTWQNIVVENAWVAVACREMGGEHAQGTGSLTIIDSLFRNVPYPIVIRNGGPYPAILLENLKIENCASVVLVDGGETLLAGTSGSTTIAAWGMGKRYTTIDAPGEYVTGFLDSGLKRPAPLVDSSGAFFARSKPTYESGGFVVATDYGISNAGTGDQSAAINKLLAGNVGTPIFFPSGIYTVARTIFVPVGSIIVGELWPQIMGYGEFFGDEENPQVMIRVGNKGDRGVVEISDMLWSVKGATAGAIMMEWNVHESTQGSAAMWDSHFRVGGGYGSELTQAECPKGSTINRDCMAAFLLFHVTESASGYFENVWVWTADHDMDVAVPGGVETTTDAQINVFTARGVLVNSQGPCWFYGSGSEHHQLYQYQLSGAKNIFMTHIQTESPYYQPSPDALAPYKAGALDDDPLFEECERGSTCMDSWAVRVLNSRDVLIYTAGLYSWFNEYAQECLVSEDCQERVLETSYTEGFWMYNTFSKATVEIFTPRGGISAILQSDDNQYGYTTEVNAWHALAFEGGDLGGVGTNGSVVYIDPVVYSEPNVECEAPCTFVMPPSSLTQATTISIPPYTTSLIVGTTTTTITVRPPPITTTAIDFSNVPATDPGEVTPGAVFTVGTSLDVDPVVVTLTVNGQTTTRTLTLPPWPQITQGPPDEWTSFYDPWIEVSDNTTTWSPPDQGQPSPTFPPVSTTSTEDEPLPTWTEWPPAQIAPLDDDDEDDDDDDDLIIIPCEALWFFDFCIDFPELQVIKWKFWWPPGVFPPGPLPPKFVEFGWDIVKGQFPPWPEVTKASGPDPTLDYPEKPTNCATETNELVLESVSMGLSNSNGQIVTTTSSTITRTATILGCKATSVTTTGSACALERRDEPSATAKAVLSEATGTGVNTVAFAEPTGDTTVEESQDDNLAHLGARQVNPQLDQDTAAAWAADLRCIENPQPYIIYPREYSNSDTNLIRARLEAVNGKEGITYREVRSDALDFTAFFVAESLPKAMYDGISRMRQVRYIYNAKAYVSNPGFKPTPYLPETTTTEPQTRSESVNGTDDSLVDERALAAKIERDRAWHLSQISYPYSTDDWSKDTDYLVTGENGEVKYNYYREDTDGNGQVIYIIDDLFVGTLHNEFADTNVVEYMSVDQYWPNPGQAESSHGLYVAAEAVGTFLGVAPRASAILVSMNGVFSGERPLEGLIEATVMVAEHVAKNGVKGKGVLNLSAGVSAKVAQLIPPYKRAYLKILQLLQDELQVVFVAASGNSNESGGRAGDTMPQVFAQTQELKSMLVVGAVDKNGMLASFSNLFKTQEADNKMIYAPGVDVLAPERGSNAYVEVEGTSYAAPMAAGLVAYLRSLPSEKWSTHLEDPAVVKQMVSQLQIARTIQWTAGDGVERSRMRYLWNGQIKDKSCLVEKAEGCPDWLLGPAGPGGPGGSGQGEVTYNPGPPSPTCKGGAKCGTLCKGYYCEPSPTGFPPDYADPSGGSVTTRDPPSGTTSGRPTLPPISESSTDLCRGKVSTTTSCNGIANCVTSTTCVPEPGPTDGGPTIVWPTTTITIDPPEETGGGGGGGTDGGPGVTNPDGTPKMCGLTPMDSCNFGMQYCRVSIETSFHLYDGSCSKLAEWNTNVPWDPDYASLTSPLPYTIELSNMDATSWGAITGDLYYAGRHTVLGPDSSYCYACGYMDSCTCCQKAFVCH